MDAECEKNVRMLFRERLDHLEVRAFDRRHDEASHARIPGGGHDGITVVVELGRIEMNVGVDQHACRQRPVHTGGRFATNASIPSAASSHTALQAMVSAAI